MRDDENFAARCDGGRAHGQTEVQPLPNMDPELSAPPPPLPEATIPSRHDAVTTGEEGDELDYDELSQPDS